MADFILEFRLYLEQFGFLISQDKMEQVFRLCRDCDLGDPGSFLPVFSVLFCTSRKQEQILEGLFWTFLKAEKIVSGGETVEEKKARIEQEYERKQEELKARQATEKENLEEGDGNGITMTKPQAQAFQKYGSLLRQTSLNEESVKGLESGKAKGLETSDFRKLESELLEKSRDAMLKGEDITGYLKLSQALRFLEKELEMSRMSADRKKSMLEQKHARQRSDLKRAEKRDIMKAEREREELQEEIDRLLGEAEENTVTWKETSESHRPVFHGRGSIWATEEHPEFQKHFPQLSKTEQEQILYYVRENVLKFKTRMMQRVYGNQGRRIDMGATIRETCRTGGLPYHILKERPKPNKARLLLVLDISGSCSGASAMLLSFMDILKDVFPNGCRTFAFVNSLYDISGIMGTGDTRQAIKEVFSAIPVRGVYSDYGRPLKTLWETHRKDITSDTVTIIMGDARNNNRDTGEEYAKNISRCSKKALWLNTEVPAKWDQGDSKASLYGKYFRMMPVLNVNQLMDFIWNI